jgi:hypothetical protein
MHLEGGPAVVCWGGTASRRIWGQMLGRDGRPPDLGPDVGEGQAAADLGPDIGEGRPLPLDPGAPPRHLLPAAMPELGYPAGADDEVKDAHRYLLLHPQPSSVVPPPETL